MGSQPEYTLPTLQVSFDGFLFDMDGTIIDSTAAVVKHWNTSVKPLSLLLPHKMANSLTRSTESATK